MPCPSDRINVDTALAAGASTTILLDHSADASGDAERDIAKEQN